MRFPNPIESRFRRQTCIRVSEINNTSINSTGLLILVIGAVEIVIKGNVLANSVACISPPNGAEYANTQQSGSNCLAKALSKPPSLLLINLCNAIRKGQIITFPTIIREKRTDLRHWQRLTLWTLKSTLMFEFGHSTSEQAGTSGQLFDDAANAQEDLP
ncbi:hypothetical protein LguiB_027273 [Lonicera macranthoides]